MWRQWLAAATSGHQPGAEGVVMDVRTRVPSKAGGVTSKAEGVNAKAVVAVVAVVLAMPPPLVSC